MFNCIVSDTWQNLKLFKCVQTNDFYWTELIPGNYIIIDIRLEYLKHVTICKKKTLKKRCLCLPPTRKQLHKNVNIKVQGTWFPNLLAYDNPGWVDMPLKSINQSNIYCEQILEKCSYYLGFFLICFLTQLWKLDIPWVW